MRIMLALLAFTTMIGIASAEIGKAVIYSNDRQFYTIAERGAGVTFKDSTTGAIIIRITGKYTSWNGILPPATYFSQDGKYATVCPRRTNHACGIYSTASKRLAWTAPYGSKIGRYSVSTKQINEVSKIVRMIIRNFEGVIIEDVTYDCFLGNCEAEKYY